jgi:cytochrome b561
MQLSWSFCAQWNLLNGRREEIILRLVAMHGFAKVA